MPLVPQGVGTSAFFHDGDDSQRVRFNRDVRPLLSDRCFHCHGRDEHARKAKLRLDQADGPHGAYRVRKGSRAIQPGSLEGSVIWHRLTTEDADDMMPPAGSCSREDDRIPDPKTLDAPHHVGRASLGGAILPDSLRWLWRDHNAQKPR